MSSEPAADVDRLVRSLRAQVGDGLRAVVEYTPQSGTIHYLRTGIDEGVAEARLVRIEELYHSERLSAAPVVGDPEFGRLYASVHLFEGSVVLHLVEPSGVVYGLSFEHAVGDPLLGFVRDCVESLYGEVPEGFPG